MTTNCQALVSKSSAWYSASAQYTTSGPEALVYTLI